MKQLSEIGSIYKVVKKSLRNGIDFEEGDILFCTENNSENPCVVRLDILLKKFPEKMYTEKFIDKEYRRTELYDKILEDVPISRNVKLDRCIELEVYAPRENDKHWVLIQRKASDINPC